MLVEGLLEKGLLVKGLLVKGLENKDLPLSEKRLLMLFQIKIALSEFWIDFQYEKLSDQQSKN